jgi:hypothetical protein
MRRQFSVQWARQLRNPFSPQSSGLAGAAQAAAAGCSWQLQLQLQCSRLRRTSFRMSNPVLTMSKSRAYNLIYAHNQSACLHRARRCSAAAGPPAYCPSPSSPHQCSWQLLGHANPQAASANCERYMQSHTRSVSICNGYWSLNRKGHSRTSRLWSILNLAEGQI